jgi:hypothetical protein
MKKNYFMVLGVLTVLVCVILNSCTTGDQGISGLFGSSSHALLYLGSKAISENEVEFEFSRPITVRQLNFQPELKILSMEEGKTVRVKTERAIEPGILLTVDLLAEDERRNSINVLTSFRSRNNRMPGLVINELCTEFSNPRTEFIEFKITSDGNLGAMRVFIVGNSNASRETIFEFRPVEVKRNEYIVLHLRSVEEGIKDEYGTRLDESGGRNASPTARDFWIPENTKRIHREASAVYVLDQDDNVLTGVMISNQTVNWWGKEYFAEIAEMLFSQDAWKSRSGQVGGPVDAINSTGTTNTRTINRDETVKNTNTNADWYITATSGATPGRPNDTRRHQ